MERWERREQKQRGRKSRMEKHGRSILTAISAAEGKRVRRLKKRAESRKPGVQTLNQE